VDCVRRVPRQIRPRPHPPDECSVPFSPCPEEPGPGAFELGAEDDEALDICSHTPQLAANGMKIYPATGHMEFHGGAETGMP